MADIRQLCSAYDDLKSELVYLQREIDSLDKETDWEQIDLLESIRSTLQASKDKIASYLENGGKLFVTGSEIGWDLGRSHSASQPGDLSFYNNYFNSL